MKMSLARAGYVIGRRDFTATVYSKSFLLFLLTPLLIMGISFGFGMMSANMARQDMRANVGVIASAAEFREMSAARNRLNPAFGQDEMPNLVHFEPDLSEAPQVKDLLASRDRRIIAVMTGGIARPTLTGDIREDGTVRKQVQLILDQVRQQRALAGAGAAVAPGDIRLVKVDESAGSLASTRAMTARLGQMILFLLTVLLSTMLLSNLVEEKTNKILEVLAAAIPIDAIFVGKLFSMLAVSLVGISVWAAGAFIAVQFWPSSGGVALPEPAVGWPIFAMLVLVYYSSNYLLLGALFLGIGSQAASIREVQTLSMPVTIGQLLVFLFASFAAGPFNSALGIGAAIFPFSSPLAMIARAAQTPELWTHALAILWQALWVWLTVKLSASFFRRNVMKSGSAGSQPEAVPARG
jgi:ABC-2 type transport system permease protein